MLRFGYTGHHMACLLPNVKGKHGGDEKKKTRTGVIPLRLIVCANGYYISALKHLGYIQIIILPY